MIKKLQITNFRNYKNVSLNLNNDDQNSKNIIVIYGENGRGKTNILESISVFSENNGLRKAKYDDITNQNSEINYWRVFVETSDYEFSSGYKKDGSVGKRMYTINDKSVRNLSEFLKENYVLWLTNETDRIFLQSPSNRRNFIDLFCSIHNKNHLQNVLNYEKLTRERLKILKQHCNDLLKKDIDSWLNIIEEKIAEIGILIIAQRIKNIEELELFQLSGNKFPKFKNQMTGDLENSIMYLSAEERFTKYKAELRERRQKDAFSGSTTFGPNRSDWKVFNVDKNIGAEFCSTGEQKIILSGVFLSFVAQNLKVDKRNLILLLDDVIAHLDEFHRNLFFRYVRLLASKVSQKVMIFLTGTDKNFFNELKDSAIFFRVHDNIVEEG